MSTDISEFDVNTPQGLQIALLSILKATPTAEIKVSRQLFDATRQDEGTHKVEMLMGVQGEVIFRAVLEDACQFGDCRQPQDPALPIVETTRPDGEVVKKKFCRGHYEMMTQA